MGHKAMVTVDLRNTTSTQRQTFNEKMEKEKWTKIPNLTTVWRASFKDDVLAADLIRITKSDVAAAAAAARITDWSAAVMYGPKAPDEF